MAQDITALGGTHGTTHGTMAAMQDGMTLGTQVGIQDGTIRGTMAAMQAGTTLGTVTTTGITTIIMLAGTEDGILIGDTIITTTEWLQILTTRTDGTAQEEPPVPTVCSPAAQASEAASAAGAR